MNVNVDLDRCQGNARCASIAPEIFELDEQGYAHVKTNGAVSDSQLAAVISAQRNCPERAISVMQGFDHEDEEHGDDD